MLPDNNPNCRMWLQHSLILIFLLMPDGGKAMASEVTSSEGSSGQCIPPYVGVGEQCLLVGTPTSGPCTSPFTLVGDQCLYFATFAELNYAEAQQMCHSLDGELVVINTPTRHKNIVDYIHANGLDAMDYWIDGNDKVTEGDWVFSSGTSVPMGTPFWCATTNYQEPNDASGDEDCLQLKLTHSFYMNDYHCNYSRPCLCEQVQQANKTVLVPRPRLECPPFFVEVGGLCLAFMTWADQTWSEARQSCHGLGGELAAITDIEHLRAIYLYLHQEGIASHSFWLGGTDTATEGIWTWTDSTSVPMGTPFWGMKDTKGIQEPAGGTGENCLLLNAEGYHYFRDDVCDLLMNPLCLYSI